MNDGKMEFHMKWSGWGMAPRCAFLCVCFEARHPFCVDMVQIQHKIQMVSMVGEI